MLYLIFFINKVELVIEILLGIRFILSWVAPTMNNGFTDLVYSLTEPLLRPFRSILNFGSLNIDLSPMILIFIIRIIKSIFIKILILLTY